MKKILYLILLLPFLSYSQIIVTSANLPNIGDTVITAEDSGNYLPGPSGANQNWNFANAAGMPDMRGRAVGVGPPELRLACRTSMSHKMSHSAKTNVFLVGLGRRVG